MSRFPTLENFHHTVKRLSTYGLTEYDCLNGIKAACDFFGMPMPARIEDFTDRPFGQTMFISSNPSSFADDIICYDLEELKRLGIYGKDAFTLVLTHECTHRLLQNTKMPGLDDGRWEEELCCDFFMGVRAGLDHISFKSFDLVRNSFSLCSGSRSHPIGILRKEILSYGLIYVANFDIIHRVRRTIPEYLMKFNEWRLKNDERIKEAQAPFYR